MKIEISACVIVKNEQKNITRWIAGVKSLADELVVVDTGSTDATAVIAKEAGAAVYNFPWCDDFAAAKNFALEKAHGIWIIFLDADESFSDESLPRLRMYIEKFKSQLKIVGFICRLINIDQDDNNRVKGEIKQLRVFRNLHDIRYQGRVHETLQNLSIHGRRVQFLSDVKIIHTGYSSAVMKKKLERNFSLLQKNIAQHGERPTDLCYLMDCYYGLEDYEKAAAYAREIIKKKIRLIGMDGHPYMCLISSLMKLHSPVEEIFSVLDQAMKEYPGSVGFLLLKAILYWQEGKCLQTEAILQNIMQEKPHSDTAQEVKMADDAASFWPYAYLYWGQLAKMRLQEEVAFERWLIGLKLYPYHTGLFLSVYDCLRGQDTIAVLEFLNSIYDKTADADFLVQCLSAKNAGPVYVYYAKLAKSIQKDQFADYMAIGRFDAAAIEVMDCLDSFYRLGMYSLRQQGMPLQETALAALLPDDYLTAWDMLERDDADLTNGAECNGSAAGIASSIQNMQHAMSEGAQDAIAVEDIEKLTAKAAALFQKGQPEQGIQMLYAACKKHPQEPMLAYGAATLLQLIGDKDRARRLLLVPKSATDEIKELWKELQEDTEYPLVSIMIPTYNRPDFFAQTLQSACTQTYTNIEILVCDNSTNEDTAKIMQQYKDDLRVCYWRNPEARSKAENFQPFEKLAKGKFLQWLMDDDLLHPEKIEKMMQVFKKYPQATLVSSNRSCIDSAGSEIKDLFPKVLNIHGEYEVFSGECLGNLLLTSGVNFLGEPSAVLFRRADLDHHYWQADCRGYQTISDVVMWLELLEKGEGIVFREPLSSYRSHRGQEGQQPETILLSRIEWLRILREYREKDKFINEEEYQRRRLELCGEQVDFLRVGLNQLVSEKLWQQYMDCMREIGEISF